MDLQDQGHQDSPISPKRTATETSSEVSPSIVSSKLISR